MPSIPLWIEKMETGVYVVSVGIEQGSELTMGRIIRECHRGVAECPRLYQAEAQLPHVSQFTHVCSWCLRRHCLKIGMVAVLKG